LGYFPLKLNYSTYYVKQIAMFEANYKTYNAATSTISVEKLDERKQKTIDSLNLSKDAERQKNSYAGRIGQFIEPVMQPVGFDWRMSVSLLSGIAAKEVIISTMGILYQSGSTDKDDKRLIQRLHDSSYLSGPKIGQKTFSPIAAMSFLAFILIYFPCIAVITAIGNESGSWKIAMFEVGYTTVLAWVMSFLIYQLGNFIF